MESKKYQLMKYLREEIAACATRSKAGKLASTHNQDGGNLSSFIIIMMMSHSV